MRNCWGWTPSAIDGFDHPPEIVPSDADIEYRFSSEKRQFDVTTVTFQQTCLGLPVWLEPISVHLKHLSNSFKVISAQIKRHDTLTRDRL